jgi:hypothetical protein
LLPERFCRATPTIRPELRVTEPRERDAMICRSCGNEERASEGYPCVNCGTFLCIICNLRGVIQCRKCQEQGRKPGEVATA